MVRASHGPLVIMCAKKTLFGDGRVRLRLSFQALGLDTTSTEEKVRNAYIALAKVYHPDSKDERASPEKFSKVRK